MGSYIRHTMGNDWGGRTRENPIGAKPVTKAQVEAAAEAAGVEVRRGDYRDDGSFRPAAGSWSMWWVRRPGGVWRTLASTSYRAVEMLASGRIAAWSSLDDPL